MLKDLCLLNGTSGDEDSVREYIIEKIKPYCTYEVDALGSIIAFKKGKKTPSKKVSINAHMDEVGFIVTGITDEGYLRFSTVGGIDSRVCMDRVVTVGNGVKGVIGDKAYHLLEDNEKKTCPKTDKLLIDIGATSKEEAEKAVSLGDFVYFDSPYVPESETADFTAYAQTGFGLSEHERLARLFKRLDKMGARLMLSNNDVDLVRSLYKDYHLTHLDVKRMINCDASRRTGKEVIVTNY